MPVEHKVSSWHLEIVLSTPQNACMQSYSPPTASKIKVCVTIWAWWERCSEAAGDRGATIKGSFLKEGKHQPDRKKWEEISLKGKWDFRGNTVLQYRAYWCFFPHWETETDLDGAAAMMRWGASREREWWAICAKLPWKPTSLFLNNTSAMSQARSWHRRDVVTPCRTRIEKFCNQISEHSPHGDVRLD